MPHFLESARYCEVEQSSIWCLFFPNLKPLDHRQFEMQPLCIPQGYAEPATILGSWLPGLSGPRSKLVATATTTLQEDFQPARVGAQNNSNLAET